MSRCLAVRPQNAHHFKSEPCESASSAIQDLMTFSHEMKTYDAIACSLCSLPRAVQCAMAHGLWHDACPEPDVLARRKRKLWRHDGCGAARLGHRLEG